MKEKQWAGTPWILWAIILALSWHLFFVSQHKEFSHDEFEHVHSAWYIAQGAMPYRDFYQSHNFLLWYTIAPVYNAIGGGTVLLSVLRYTMTGLLLATAFLTYRLTKLLTSSQAAGQLAAILLLSNYGVAITGLEIRPDVPQMLFEILSLYWLFQGFQKKRLSLFIISGLAFAVSFLFLQKVILIAPALAIVFLIQYTHKKITIRHIAAWLCGLAVPLMSVGLWLIWQGIFQDYLLTCWTYYLLKQPEHKLASVLQQTITREPLHWLLFISSLTVALVSFRRQRLPALFAFLGSSMLALLWFLPFISRAYILPLYPLLAIPAAATLHAITRRTPRRWSAGLIIGISVFISFMSWRLISGSTNGGYQDQIAAVQHVIAQTNPAERVYDGNNYFNLFRPDLHYFWYALDENRGLARVGHIVSERVGTYDTCQLIQTYQPKIISNYQLGADICGLADQYEVTTHRYMLQRTTTKE